MNVVGFQILAYKSIPKSPVDTPQPSEVRVLNTNFIIFVCLFFRLLDSSTEMNIFSVVFIEAVLQKWAF